MLLVEFERLKRSVTIMVFIRLTLCRHTHPLGETEAPLFKAAGTALSDVVVPYLASCFGRIFPGGSSLLQVHAVSDVLREVLE